MRFVTWNVNSVHTRVDRVVALLECSGTDVLAMQEVKCRLDQFPTEVFEEVGYHVAIHGLNQWNGVAIASRLPILDVQDHFPTQSAFDEPSVVEARALGVTVDTTNTFSSEDRQASSMMAWSLYAPNGRRLTHAHYAYKLEWLANLAEQGRGWLIDPSALIVLVDDWNVVPLDEDVRDTSAFEGATYVSASECEAFTAFTVGGWVEATRERVTNYTYWDYQKLRLPKNEGMRIDFTCCLSALAARTSGAQIGHDERKGKGASDHVPVIVDVD